MSTHEFNVYETLETLDSLLESGHTEPSPMDRAEYQILTNKLVQGALELLRHLALHDVLVLESADALHPVSTRQVNSVSTDRDGAFSDEVVAIDLPSELVPYGAIIESMKTWNLGTVETVADLTTTARLYEKYLAADVDSDMESLAFQEWCCYGGRIAEKAMPAVALLEAAGLLRVVDLRTHQNYPPLVSVSETSVGLQMTIESDPDVREQSRSRSPRKKKATTSRTRKRSSR
jgi:hypothetical protein